MATGYTADIAKGITFETFIMNCARAFGACITMRDDSSGTPIPEEFKPSNYNQERLDEAKKVGRRLLKMKIKTADREARKEYDEEIDRRMKTLEDKLELNLQYSDMLAKVKAWTPPTPDHEELKGFMIQQITESAKWDCSTDNSPPPPLLTGVEWRQKKVDEAAKDIEYHTKAHAEEVKRVKGRNTWVRNLRESIS